MGYGFRDNSGGGRFGGDRGGRGGGGFRPRFPREMHKIKCSECGKDAEVPFRPKQGLPVYCRDCFMKKKGITPREPIQDAEAPAEGAAPEGAAPAEEQAAPVEEKVEAKEDSKDF